MQLIVDNVKIKYTTLEEIYKNWIPIALYLPHPFDIVELKLTPEKIITGWYTGRGFDGYKMKNTDKVIYWRRIWSRYETEKQNRENYA